MIAAFLVWHRSGVDAVAFTAIHAIVVFFGGAIDFVLDGFVGHETLVDSIMLMRIFDDLFENIRVETLQCGRQPVDELETEERRLL